MENVLTYSELRTRDLTFFVRDAYEKYEEKLDAAIASFNKRMAMLAKEALNHPEGSPELARVIDGTLFNLADRCAEYERAIEDADLIRNKRQELRDKTNHIFSTSYFMNRARTWPQGYQGDYLTLEGVYRNIPLSIGIGRYLDMHFLNSVLGNAVRGRLRTLESLLREEFESKKDLQVLNIACGSCRELFQLAPQIAKTDATLTCVDFDSESLVFSQNRSAQTGIPAERLLFRKYNALRMVNAERNRSEFGMQDIIYSVGLFDYLEDNVLVRLFTALYRLLNPGGKLILSFKDRRRYNATEYRWFVNWDGFYQRTEEGLAGLLALTDIPQSAFRTLRDDTGVILFFVASKE